VKQGLESDEICGIIYCAGDYKSAGAGAAGIRCRIAASYVSAALVQTWLHRHLGVSLTLTNSALLRTTAWGVFPLA